LSEPRRAAENVCLFVIVPVYGNEADTLDCLRMLGEQSNRDFQVIVSDDGSPNPPPDWIDDFSFITWQRNSHAGFAANCNAGARAALSRGATHLIFLNNDTAFGRDFVAGWLQTIHELPDAIVSPIVYWFDRPDEVWFSGGRQGIHVPFFRLNRAWKELTEVDIVSGCAVLVPASAWLALRGFDEGFLMYYEDFDFCLRAKRLGIRIYVAPDSALAVRHKVARSSVGNFTNHYAMITYRYVFIRRYYRGGSMFLCFLLSVPQLAAILVRSLPRFPNVRRLVTAIGEGLRLPSQNAGHR
jgi:GT2 family glycosyltransferase